jgi:nucleoside-diphosphate-sugar epimerase
MGGRALVTGGGGFIGSNLTRALLSEGYAVRILDDFSTGRRINLSGLARDVELIEGDVLDRELLRAALRGVSVVFHQAAIPAVARSVADPERSHRVNVSGTLSVLIAARDAGVERMVYASSSSVYGGTAGLAVHEELPTHPLSPYAASKLAAESYCRSFWTTYQLPTISLRYFNVFGPRQDPGSQYSAVIPRFIAALLAGVPPVVYGDGEQSRDFTYIDCAVAANVLAARAGAEAFGRAFNIAQGNGHTLNDLLTALREITGVRGVDATFGPPRPGDILHSRADIEAAARVLGYDPTVSLDEGLRRTVAWFADQEAIALPAGVRSAV